MISWTPFSEKLSEVLQEAFANPGEEPESISDFLKDNLPKRSAVGKDKFRLKDFLLERGIKEIVHFTRIENVPNILRFGLIPRVHLEEESIRAALNPYFSDEIRVDNSPLANCLSFSFPNYRMFYSKRAEFSKNSVWAVLSIDPIVVVNNFCQFSPSNAASAGADARSSLEQVQRLFSNLKVRKDSGLLPYETTDPQAEILEDTVILPEWINHVYVENRDALACLAGKNVTVSIDKNYFSPRRDYVKWQQKTSFYGADDYEEVLDYESRKTG